jgi:hypothetical protein
VNLWLRIGVSIPGLLVTRDEAVSLLPGR